MKKDQGITKGELIKSIHLKMPHGSTLTSTAAFYSALVEVLQQAIADKTPVRLAGIGLFETVAARPKKGRSFGGDEISIPAKYRVRFVPAIQLKRALPPLTAQ